MVAFFVRFAILRPTVVVILAVLVVAAGLHSLTRAHLDVFPEFAPKQVVIQTEAAGLSAELVETQVTQRLENALGGVGGVESMRSQSIPGLSVVTLIFREGSNLYRNRQAVAERLALVRLPAGVSAPAMTPLTSSASTVLGVGVTSGQRSLMELRTLVDWTLKPHLLSVEGVADVNVFGGEVRQWQVQVDPERLAAHGLGIEDVLTATRAAIAVQGAGFIENSSQRIVLGAYGQAGSPEEIGRALLARRQGRPVTIADVARVTEAPAPSISAAAIDGERGVFMMVQGQFGANTRAVTLGLEKALAELKPMLAAQQVELHPRLFRPANFIETAVANVRSDILVGSVLVVGVLLAFLFNVRTALICATAIPVSLLAAVLVLDVFGISLNVMVLGGLVIALGEVVDDAIIDTENIFRRLRESRTALPAPPAREVVLNASLEVRSSVVHATFIVALVFVPLLSLSGVAGRLFWPLALAYIFAILASLVVAMTLTPALCHLLLSRAPLKDAHPPLVRWLRPRYGALLRRIERRPALVVAVVGIGLVAGVSVLPTFEGEFIPALKEGHYIVHMSALPGTSEAESLRIGKRVAEVLGEIPGVQSVAQWVGRAERGADTFGPHYSEFEVEVGALPGADQARVLAAIRDALDDDDGGFPGMAFAVNTFLTERIEETLSGYAASFVASVHGADLDLLDRDANAIARALEGVEGARDVQVQAPPGAPELAIRLQPGALADAGVTASSALDAARAAYEGAAVGQVFREGQAIPVAVILAPEFRNRVGEVGRLPLRAAEGGTVPLARVADIRMINGRYKILHAGAKRIQTVTANVEGRDLEAFEDDARSRVAALSLSPGSYVVYGGAAQAQAQARGDLLAQSLLAGVGVLLLLYLAFDSVRNLALAFLNLPFALVGGVVAVLATGGWLSLGSLVGFVTLFGITLRNSIMLVSHCRHLVADEGLPWGLETAVRAAQERLPSILMTALVTALGLLPLALGSGQPGREIEGPMAIVIVGGLVTSTLLNLLVLPTLLLHLGRFGSRAER